LLSEIAPQDQPLESKFVSPVFLISENPIIGSIEVDYHKDTDSLAREINLPWKN